MAFLDTSNSEHLGDGAYVAFDGYQIWVWCERDGRKEAVALECSAMVALVAYYRKLGGVLGSDPDDD